MKYIGILLISIIFILNVFALETVHSISGKIISINEPLITVIDRNGKQIIIDDSQAVKNELATLPFTVGRSITAIGDKIENNGALLAISISRAKSQSSFWPIDK